MIKKTSLASKGIASKTGKGKKSKVQGNLVVFGTKPKDSSAGVKVVDLGFVDKSKEKAKADVESNLGATQSLQDLFKLTGW